MTTAVLKRRTPWPSSMRSTANSYAGCAESSCPPTAVTTRSIGTGMRPPTEHELRRVAQLRRLGPRVRSRRARRAARGRPSNPPATDRRGPGRTPQPHRCRWPRRGCRADATCIVPLQQAIAAGRSLDCTHMTASSVDHQSCLDSTSRAFDGAVGIGRAVIGGDENAYDTICGSWCNRDEACRPRSHPCE